MNALKCKNGDMHDFTIDERCACGVSVERYRQALKTKTKIMDALGALMDVCNGNDADYVSWCMLQSLAHTHPTLQQMFFKSLRAAIMEMPNNLHSDARNEATMEWCRKVAEIDAYFPLI